MIPRALEAILPPWGNKLNIKTKKLKVEYNDGKNFNTPLKPLKLLLGLLFSGFFKVITDNCLSYLTFITLSVMLHASKSHSN